MRSLIYFFIKLSGLPIALFIFYFSRCICDHEYVDQLLQPGPLSLEYARYLHNHSKHMIHSHMKYGGDKNSTNQKVNFRLDVARIT